MLRHRSTLLLAAGLAALAAGPDVAGALDATYLYNLSTTTGVVPTSGLALSCDERTKEVFVIGDSIVRIFNEAGMEVFSFGGDPELGTIVALSATETGDLLLLSMLPGHRGVIRANFRGDFVSEIPLSGLPPEFADFQANAMGYAKGRIYLANLGEMRLVIVDSEGKYLASYDFAAMIEDIGDAKRHDYGLRGFRVGPRGEVLFTVQTLFKAFVLSPEGDLRGFGRKGSAPGKFNVITGIASDEQGRYYVADILKSAVLVFDKDFNWLKEFGYRGRRPGSLISPVDLVAFDGKVFVSQYARKGVAVFKITDPRESE